MDEIIKNTTYPRRWSFREFDFFSGGTGIKIKGDERVKSFLGAFITVVIYILLGLSTGYYILQFLDETSPKIQYNRRQLPMPSEFRFPDSGMNFFFLVTNPSPKAGTTDDFYLTVDTLKKYYTATSIYQESNYTINGTVTIKNETKRIPIDLVPCNQTTWFNDPTNQEILKQNLFTMFIIQNFGICPNMTSEVVIFGDDQTVRNGRYRFRLEICSPANCVADYMNILTNSGEQSIIIGAFEPAIENSDKANPWKGAVNLDHLVPIGMFLNTRATMSLKEVDIETDTGIIISKTNSRSKSGINSIRRDYTPVVSMGEPIGASTSLYSVRSLARKPPIFEFRLISSRSSEGYARSYVTILDLFGSIGGSIEFIIVVFLVFFNWIEIRYSDSRARFVTAKSLGLPKMMKPGMRMFGYSAKHQHTELLAEASEVIDELTDSTISLEQMSLDRLLVRFYLDHSIPEDIRLLIPTVSVMKEIIEKRKDQQSTSDVDSYVKTKYKGGKDQMKARRKSAALAKTYLHQNEKSALFSVLQNLVASSAEESHKVHPPAIKAQPDQHSHKKAILFEPHPEATATKLQQADIDSVDSMLEAPKQKVIEDFVIPDIPNEVISHSQDEEDLKKDKKKVIGVPRSNLDSPMSSALQTPQQRPTEQKKGATVTNSPANPFAALIKPRAAPLAIEGTQHKDGPDSSSLVLREGEKPYHTYLGVLSDGEIDLPDSLEPGSLLEAYFSTLNRVRDSQVIDIETGKLKRPADEFSRMRHQILLTVKNFAEAVKNMDLRLMFEEENHHSEKLSRGFTWLKTTPRAPNLARGIGNLMKSFSPEAVELKMADPEKPTKPELPSSSSTVKLSLSASHTPKLSELQKLDQA